MLSISKSLALALCLAPATQALNILMNNDDGFGSANTRELYRILKEDGHDVWMVAPAVDNSGQGSRLSFASSANLTTATEDNLVPSGAPSLGPDPNDSHIWYYNGTPAVCTFVGLDYVLPTFANFSTPDLLVSGPNFGQNIGTFAFLGSGTIGATQAAVMRNIPAVAFSAANSVTSYKALTNASNPATWAAQMSARFVNILANNTAPGKRVLPYGFGINVNLPTLNKTCTPSAPFVESRIGGDAGLPQVAYNKTSGLIYLPNNNYFSFKGAGLNQCFQGNCNLPGESDVIQGCAAAVSIFTMDFTAGFNSGSESIRRKLGF